jgi:hypothetical protein
MSLRMFHLFFIALSVILAAFFAAWAMGQYRVDHDLRYVVVAVVSFISGGALVLYGRSFQRKTRSL